MVWFWLAVLVLFGVVEMMTAGLISVWFVVGSAFGMLAAGLGFRVLVQFTVFAVASGVALIALRPLLVITIHRGDRIATNADRLIGEAAKVTEAIDNLQADGAVKVNGTEWTARSADGALIPVGALVTILRIDGVKLIVEPIGQAN